MNEISGAKFYPPAEERINIVSHSLGLVLSVIALFFLISTASMNGNAWDVAIFSVFGISLIALYLTSAIYHATKDPQRRKRLRVVDHAMIYVLIAGTYTPLALITLHGSVGWTLFGASWGVAATGIALKLFFTGRFEVLSTVMYVAMGWMAIFAIKPLLQSMSLDGLYWLLAGGLAYTFGAILYAIKKIPFNHAIFHVFVLIGSSCHFVTIYFYVLPGSQTG